MHWMLSSIVIMCLLSAAQAGEARVGRLVENFGLRDYRGRIYTLDEFVEAELVVVAFLGVECPLAQLYGPRLQALRDEYQGRGVEFLGVDANSQDTLEELAGYARRHGIVFPLLKDPGNVVADTLGATRTPEVFVLDAERTVRYCGRIDDQFAVGVGSGSVRPTIKRRYLAEALDELLADRPVSEPTTEAVGCLIGRVPSIEPHGEITYSRHIARILQERCITCHRPGEVAPFALLNYEEVVGWAPTIREVVEQGRMPPWPANPDYGHFQNDSKLTAEERRLVAEWVENGCPPGDPSERPPPKEFVEGWQIPRPDAVVYMADRPFVVAADGAIDYQYFTADPDWQEDRWIKAIEVRPGNRSVVHHIIVYVQPPGAMRPAFELDMLGTYAPGGGCDVFPPGIAARLPAGSKFVFELHYTPNGSIENDRSYVGFKFADAGNVRKQLIGGKAYNLDLSIPPGDANHQVTSQQQLDQDMLLLSLMPHLHLRGKSFRYEAWFPDGRSEILLDVPRYDFNWQLTYRLSEPKLLPAGTTLHCTATFDNSEENPANPDPTDHVTWGSQSWDEMMIGFFQAVHAGEPDISARRPAVEVSNPAVLSD